MFKKLLIPTLLCLFALPLAAQINDTYVIPASANVPGAFGTRWMTNFSIFNPQQYELEVAVVYLPTAASQPIERSVVVPSNSVAYSDNILDDLFDTSGGGALLIATFPEDNPGVEDSVVARSFLVTSNTFNNASGGTFGQTIPGTWTGLFDYEYDGVSSVAHGIRNIDRLGWRTNVGAANLGRCNATLLVSVYDVNGRTLLDKARFNIPPFGHFQDRLPVQVDRGSVEFFVEDPCVERPEDSAVVFPYTSQIDQLSGDPTYQNPTLLATAGFLYGKKGFDPTNIGKRITTVNARSARTVAKKLGRAELEKSGNGYKIVK
ncbi:MAG TPA: hypothetical protein VF618_13330 [Thermoanaerobaculia bacterium]